MEELSVDGGKVRLRTPMGKPCEWRDYKAIALHKLGMAATFQDNACLSDWVNRQPRSEKLTCIGDGHDGIWNLVTTFGHRVKKSKGWYHLVENLYSASSAWRRILRRGDVEAAVAAEGQWFHHRVTNFKAYLANHRHRIPNYSQLQAQGVSIGSGAIESAIKQIGRRVKISGAQWKRENVPQVLRHRTAYLNGLLSS